MKRLRLWRRMKPDEKSNAAEQALRAAVAARSYWDIDADDDWLDVFPPIEVAGVVMNAVEELLGVSLEWDYVAEKPEEPGMGATGYWFRVTDPETGFVLTYNPDKRSLSFYKYIESAEDVKNTIIQLANIIVAKLPRIRTVYRQFGELFDPKEV